MMEYAAYRFGCRLTTEACLPPFKGSTIRGVFGRALKQVVCALRRTDCNGCLLRAQCLYPLVFENPSVMPAPKSQRGYTSHPHPFVIRLPKGTQTRYSLGDLLDFQLIFFGTVNQHLPYFIYALKEMGRIGLGRRINGRRGRFSLEFVTNDSQCIYSEKTGILVPILPIDLQLALLPSFKSSPRRDLTLFLKTPLRIKKNNHLKDKLPFDLLIRTALRRIASLMTYYDSGEPDIDYHGLIQLAETIKIKNHKLRWHDWNRYSFRQRERLKIGGLLGRITYADVPATFLPLIDFVQKVHLGKQTTFGMGEIAVGG